MCLSHVCGRVTLQDNDVLGIKCKGVSLWVVSKNVVKVSYSICVPERHIMLKRLYILVLAVATNHHGKCACLVVCVVLKQGCRSERSVEDVVWLYQWIEALLSAGEDVRLFVCETRSALDPQLWIHPLPSIAPKTRFCNKTIRKKHFRCLLFATLIILCWVQCWNLLKYLFRNWTIIHH